MTEQSTNLTYLLPDDMPPPFASYSHGVVVKAGSDMVFCSGQLGIGKDAEVPQDAGAQAELCFKNVESILKAAGMTYADIGKVEYLPFAESVDLMKNRQLAATLQSAGLGVASLKDLSNSNEINVVSVPKETVEKIGPPFIAATIPANTYKGQDKDVETAAVVNYLVTHSGVSDETAYQMTKLLFESLPELANAHVAGKDIKLETAASGSPVPLHPGAVRYHKEKGILK